MKIILFPFIFYVQKGNLSSAQQVYGQNINDSIQLTLNLPCVPTGIKNQTSDKFFCNLFPNPSSGLINVVSSCKDLNIEIVNFLGENIYSTKINSDKTEIDLRKFSNGHYFYRIFSDSKAMQTGKIFLDK